MLQGTLKFELPAELNAAMPPERRGIRRDHVKIMVQERKTGLTKHDRFFNLDRYLKKGDVLVLNSSRTLPAILKADLFRGSKRMKDAMEIRLARRKNDHTWEALAVFEEVKKVTSLSFLRG